MIIKKNDKCESLNFGMTSKGLNYIEELFFNEVIEYDPNIVTIMTNRNSTMYDSMEADLYLQVSFLVSLTIISIG